MGKAPAFQLYSNDFFVDTITWELDELGLYARLLFVEWSNGPLPKDHKKLAKIAGISPKKFSNLFQICSSKFIENAEGNLINQRLEQEREKQYKYSESRKDIAHKRWEKSNTHAMHMHEHTDIHTGCSSSSSSSSTSNIKDKRLKDIAGIPKNGTPPNPDIATFINYAFDSFENAFNKKMMVDGKKDGAIVKKLLGTYGLDTLKDLWDAFMQSDDPFIYDAGISIGVFKTQVNKLISSRDPVNPLISKSSVGILSWAERREKKQQEGEI